MEEDMLPQASKLTIEPGRGDEMTGMRILAAGPTEERETRIPDPEVREPQPRQIAPIPPPLPDRNPARRTSFLAGDSGAASPSPWPKRRPA